MCKDCGDENHKEEKPFVVVDQKDYQTTIEKAQGVKDLIVGQEGFSQKEKNELNNLIDGLAGGKLGV